MDQRIQFSSNYRDLSTKLTPGAKFCPECGTKVA